MEQSIIDQAQKGNDQAFRIIVQTYQHHIFRTLYAILRNSKDAEDAAQEVFLKIYLSLPQYKQTGFKTWITRIAVNHAIDMKRKAYRKREEMVEDMYVVNQIKMISQEVESIEDEILKKELKQLVQKRMNEIPENYRQVIYGFYIEEKSYQQLAEEHNVQTKTIATKLHRARNWIKKHWKEEDF